MNRILDVGYCLSVPEKNDRCFIIKKVLGKGASSVTYFAECNQTEHVLKECNPLGLHMHRENDGTLVPDTELNKVKFEEYLHRFVDGASKQLAFRLTDDLKNTTSNIQAINTNGAKNLLPISLSELKSTNVLGTWNNNVYTYVGMTYTANLDAKGNVISVTVNGTVLSGNVSMFVLGGKFSTYLTVDTQYTINGMPSNATGQSVPFMQIMNLDTYSGVANVYYNASGVAYTHTSNYANNGLVIRCNQSVSASNVTFYPMIRLASDTDSTFQPYAKTNLELTNEQSNYLPLTGGNITGDLNVSHYMYATFYNGNASVQDGLIGLSSYAMYCNEDGWFRKATLDKMKYVLSQSMRVVIPQQSNVTAGWRRLCKIVRPNVGYSQGFIYVGGNWSNTLPTQAIVEVATRHQSARMTLINNFYTDGIVRQIRLVMITGGQFWVDAYLKASSGTEGYQCFIFDGDFQITDIQNSAEIITDTVTAAATIDFTQKVIDGLMVTSNTFDSYITGSITSGNTQAVTGGAVYNALAVSKQTIATNFIVRKQLNTVSINCNAWIDVSNYTIPSGYRPTELTRINATIEDSDGKMYAGYVQIATSGAMNIYYVNGTTSIYGGSKASFSGSYIID